MERLGDDARRVLAGAGVPGVAELAAVTAVWKECVGDAIARAAWPRRVARDGTLHVAAASSTWAFELERLAGEIAARLEGALGESSPRVLRFAPGHVPEPDDDGTPAVEAPLEITAASRAEGDLLAASIDDESLRALVARAAAASLERSRSDRGFC